MKLKLSAALLAFVLLTTLVCGTLSIRAEEIDYYEKVQARLVNLDIIKEKVPKDNVVTNAEYITMLIRSLGMDGMVKTSSGGFWADGYIELADSLGLCDYCDAFQPTDPVNLKNALIMAAATLGYGNAQKGDALYETAVKLNLADKAEIASAAALTRGGVCVIVYNMLDTDICVPDSLSGSDITYKIEKGHTLLDDLFNITDRKYYEGIVEASFITSIYGSTDCRRDEVIINGTRFKTGSTAAQNYIGEYVCFYVDSENDADGGAIRHIALHKKNKTVKISSHDIEQGSLQTVTYTENGKRKKLELDNPAYLKNNKAVTQYAQMPLDYSQGSFVFVDNDGDDRYEVVIGTYIQSYIVDECFADDGILSFSDDAGCGGIEIDSDNDDLWQIVYDENANAADLSCIKKGDAVSLIKSDDGTFTAVYRCAPPFTGTITSINAADKLVEIDSKEYKYTDAAGSLSVGDSGRFYEDINGELFRMQTDYEDYVYIYKKGRAKGISQKAEIRIYDGNGFLNYTLSSKPKIDGVSRDADAAYNAIAENSVAVITVNKSGEVSKLDSGDNYAAKAERVYVENDKGFCDYNEKTAEPFVYDDNTKMFFVPKSGIEEDFFNTFPLTDDTEYETMAFDKDEQSGCAAACVVVMDCDDPISEGFNAASEIMAVNSVRALRDEDGDYTYEVSGICGREEVSFTAAQKQTVFNVLSDVESGDVIQFVLNWENEIALVSKVMDKSALSGYYYDNSDYRNVSLYGEALKVNRGVMTNLKKYLVNEIICAPNGNEIKVTVPASMEKVSGTTNKGFGNYFIYDSETKSFRNGTAGTIVTEDYAAGYATPLYIGIRNGETKFIVQFK